MECTDPHFRIFENVVLLHEMEGDKVMELTNLERARYYYEMYRLTGSITYAYLFFIQMQKVLGEKYGD